MNNTPHLRSIREDQSILTIDPRNGPTDRKLTVPGAFERFIEPPVRATIRSLNDKGITTISSSANSTDIKDGGHVSILYSSLSEPNKAVADALVNDRHAYRSNRFDREVLVIQFSISRDDTVGLVNERVMQLCAGFTSQTTFAE